MKNFVILEENHFEDTAPALAGLSFRHRREANRFPEGAGRQQSLQIPNWARKTVSDCGRRWRNQYLRRNSSWWWRLARRASSPWVFWFSPCFFFPSSGSPPWRGSTLAVPPVQSFVGLLRVFMSPFISLHRTEQVFFSFTEHRGFYPAATSPWLRFSLCPGSPVSRWLQPSLQLINTTINPFQFPAPIPDSISSGFSLHLLQEAHYLTQL